MARAAAHRVLIVGGGGMLGRKLAARLLSDGVDGVPVASILSVDRAVPSDTVGDGRIQAGAVDIVRDDLSGLIRAAAPDIVFHLAAVVSGQAEAEFDLGYSVNVDGTWRVLEAVRSAGRTPRLVFASSLAVYGGALPALVRDDLAPAPESSYGAQKAIGELLVADYARKGFLQGVCVRLPTIMVRPGAPNRAASGFLSSIVREPLAGLPATLPVEGTTGVWVASPETAIATLAHAAALPDADVADVRPIIGRGLSTTPDAILAALEAVAGSAVVARVARVPDPAIAAIVASWPRAFECARATRLGFPVDADIASVIRAHIESAGHGRSIH